MVALNSSKAAKNLEIETSLIQDGDGYKVFYQGHGSKAKEFRHGMMDIVRDLDQTLEIINEERLEGTGPIGEKLKDLDSERLTRDRIICVEVEPPKLSDFPDNLLPVSEFRNDQPDTELPELKAYIETLLSKNDPIAYLKSNPFRAISSGETETGGFERGAHTMRVKALVLPESEYEQLPWFND